MSLSLLEHHQIQKMILMIHVRMDIDSYVKKIHVRFLNLTML